jgi:hypothetical protein
MNTNEMHDLLRKSLSYRYDLDPSRIYLFGRKIVLGISGTGEINLFIDEYKNIVTEFRYRKS